MRWTLMAWLLLAALAPGKAAAQALWEGSRFGMSQAQVAGLFPQAHPPADPDQLAGGEHEALRIEQVELAGLPFRASFFFSGHTLFQVMLQLDEASARREGERAFDAVAALLRQCHGREAVAEDDAQPFPRRRLEWSVDGARVKLFYARFGQEPLLNLIYQVRPPDAPPGPRLRSH